MHVYTFHASLSNILQYNKPNHCVQYVIGGRAVLYISPIGLMSLPAVPDSNVTLESWQRATANKWAALVHVAGSAGTLTSLASWLLARATCSMFPQILLLTHTLAEVSVKGLPTVEPKIPNPRKIRGIKNTHVLALYCTWEPLAAWKLLPRGVETICTCFLSNIILCLLFNCRVRNVYC